MNKTKADIQNHCEKNTLRIADNIERLLNNKGISLNKLTKSAEIEGVSANEKQLFANLIYNFMQKLMHIKHLQIVIKMFHILHILLLLLLQIILMFL